jgi:hypothetical protein
LRTPAGRGLLRGSCASPSRAARTPGEKTHPSKRPRAKRMNESEKAVTKEERKREM